MRVPFLDLRAQARELGDTVHVAVGEVLDGQQYVLGPALARFEAAMADYTGVRHAIGVGSGTDALALALAALGVGTGDLVVTTAFTFFATASSIVRLGARPLFVDIDPRTFTIDPAAVAAALEDAPGEIVGIVPVHLYGRLAPMDELCAVAERHGCWVMEDAAQAVGARAERGMAGALARAGCLSFYPTKNLGGVGDGGMVLTGDDEVARRVRRDRHQGMTAPYHHESIGLCSRLDAVQAAALHAKLPWLDAWNERRRAIAARYTATLVAAGLAGAPGRPVEPPLPAGPAHVFHQYVVRARARDRLAEHLARRGIGTQIYYPLPLNRQPALAGHAVVPLPLDATERAAAEVLALPMYPQLEEAQIDCVVAEIASFYRGHGPGESDAPRVEGRGTAR
jgi:dTDP-4-amino-4,6-dideoxygalactose transaminase